MMALKDEWDRFDAGTRKWLLENPGCVLVPRAVTAAIQQVSAEQIHVDEHGQMILSREDLDFIRERGAGLGTRHLSDQFQLFDAAQPDKHQ
jgi:hypothetical protein